MKKLLSVLLSVVMTVAILPLSPVGTFAENADYFDMPSDYVQTISATNESIVCGFQFTAEKSGVYSIIKKTTSGKVYRKSNSQEMYTRDYRPADGAELYYFNLKKGQNLSIEFTCYENSSATVTRQSVDAINSGDEFDLTGEYDRSFIIPNLNNYNSGLKFAAETPRDSNGNPILNARYRMLKALPVNDNDTGLIFYDRNDEKINTAMNTYSSGAWSDYFILNIYANASPTTSADPATARSKVKFIKMKSYNTDDVTFNLAKNPEPIYEGSNYFSETDDDGNTYNKYYYSPKDYLKSVTIKFDTDDILEVPAELSAEDEPNPYDNRTGFYVKTTDTQKDNHWSVGTNYFVASYGDYNRENIPVEVKSASDLQSISLFEEKTVPYRAETRYYGYYSFTPAESGTYTVSVEDLNKSGTDSVDVIVGNTDYDLSNKYYYTGKTSCEYVTHDVELTAGKTYPIRFIFMRSGSGNGNIKLSVKKVVPVSSIRANKKADAPKLVDGVNKVNGKYKYDISDYVDSIDVTYTDGKTYTFAYDKDKQKFVSSADKKYSSYNFFSTDNQTMSSWTVGTNDATISLEDKSDTVPIEVVSPSDLPVMNVNEDYGITLGSDEEYSSMLSFTPAKAGYYVFDVSAAEADENCDIEVATGIYQYYQNYEAGAPMSLTDGRTYIVMLSARHSDKYKNGNHSSSDIKVKIKKLELSGSGTMTLNKTNTVSVTKESVTALYTFTPTNSGIYNFDIGTIAHNDECKIDTEYKIYYNGKEVGNTLYGGKKYSIVFIATHNSVLCSKKYYTGLRASITPMLRKIVAEPDEPEDTTTTTTTTTTTKKPTTATTTTKATTTKKPTTAKVTTTTKKVTTIKKTTTTTKKKVTTTKAVVKSPKPAAIKKLTAGKKSLTATWSKISGVAGYQLQFATDKKFSKNRKTVTVTKQKTTSAKASKLKAKTKYYVRIRTYKTVKGKKVYSKWSAVKSAKTK